MHQILEWITRNCNHLYKPLAGGSAEFLSHICFLIFFHFCVCLVFYIYIYIYMQFYWFFFKNLFLSFILSLMVVFHLQLLHNTGYIPSVVQYILEPVVFLFFFLLVRANYFTTLQWVLSYIDMNQPWSSMYSPSRSPLSPPPPPDSSGSFQCTRPEHLSHASNLGWWSVSL